MPSTTFWVFYLKWGNGKALYLHPFLHAFFPEDFFHSRTVPVGRFNSAPLPEELSRFRGQLHVNIEKYFKGMSAEKNFLRCFLAAAGVFLLVFFFLSIGIRDPIPVIDELLLSSAASVALFFFLRRKISSSNQRKEQLSFALSRIDGIVFQESTVLKLFSSMLNDYYALSLRDLQPLMLYKDTAHTFPPLNEEIRAFYMLLRYHVEGSGQRKAARLQRRMWGKKFHSKMLEGDTPLHVLYRQLGFNYFEKKNDI